MKLPILLSFLAPILALVTSCSFFNQNETQSVQLTPQQVKSTKRFHKEYVIAPGDRLEVLVVQNPGVSRTVQIRPDGKLSLPLLGDVSAAGLTFTQLDHKVTNLFSPRLKDPEVNILAVEVRSPMVYIIGDVPSPLPVELRRASTAAQAIGSAGGFRREASQKGVTLIRLDEAGHLVATNIGNLVEGKNGTLLSLQQVRLQADDIIYVPEGGRSQARRFIDDFINLPLSGVNSLLGTYTNFLLVDSITTQNQLLNDQQEFFQQNTNQP